MTTNYSGPQCPHCGVPLPDMDLRTGVIDCGACSRLFEATLFRPVERRHAGADVLVATPDGVANACANHARNAAVTSCRRCGLFICALCDMNVGEGSFCPPCFDRARAEGSLKGLATRYRDYASTARVAVVVGVFFSTMFLGLPFGGLALYYAIKGLNQRREEGASQTGMVVLIVFAVLEILSTFFLIALVAGVAAFK